MYYRKDFPGSNIVETTIMLGLFLMLLVAFLTVIAVVFVVRTFVKYPEQRKTLWIAFAVYIACGAAAEFLYQLTAFGGFHALAGIGVAVLLITCLAVDLQNRDTLMRENVNLIDAVLHTPWWGSEDRPRQELEHEQIAA